MTTPDESLRALSITREFLRSLLDSKRTPKVPRAVRNEASRCLKHYPFPCDIVKNILTLDDSELGE